MYWSNQDLNGSSHHNSLKQILTAGVLSLGILGSLVCTPGIASRLPNNRVVFDRAPELVETSTLPSTVAVEGQFQLVIQVPVDAGEPLEALVVSPRSGEGGLPFDPTATEAYLGQPSTDLVPLALASVGGLTMAPNEVLVVFGTPVPPGQSVTVVLTPKLSPRPGIYEYSITGYPAGDSPVGQFLGYEVLRL